MAGTLGPTAPPDPLGFFSLEIRYWSQIEIQDRSTSARFGGPQILAEKAGN
jgi:hypothetical protein